MSATGGGTGRRVYAELQTLAVDVVAQCLEVGEFVVGQYLSVGATLWRFPAVVDVDVLPAVRVELGVHQLSGVSHLLIVNRECPAVPTVPAHSRCEGYVFAYLDGHFLLCAALAVAGSECHLVVAGLCRLAGDVAGGMVDGHTSRQSGGVEGHRTVARGHNRPQKRVAGTCTKHQRVVDDGRCGSGRGKYVFLFGYGCCPHGYGFHLSAGFYLHVEPVGMVVHDAVATLFDEQQHFVDTLQADVERLDGVAFFHHTALPNHLAVGENLELEFSCEKVFVVGTSESRDGHSVAIKLVEYTADGVNAKSAVVDHVVDGQRREHNRLIDGHCSPVLHVAWACSKLVKPHFFNWRFVERAHEAPGKGHNTQEGNVLNFLSNVH